MRSTQLLTFVGLIVIVVQSEAFGKVDFSKWKYSESNDTIHLFQHIFSRDHPKFMETGVHISDLLQIYHELSVAPELRRYDAGVHELEDIPDEIESRKCLRCLTTMPTFFDYRRVHKWSSEKIAEAAIDVCVGTGGNATVCRGVVYNHIESTLFIVDNQLRLTPEIFCAIYDQGRCGVVSDPEFDLKISVDRVAPPITGSKNHTSKRDNEFKIVHITDIHYDLHYQVGNLAVCTAPVCCRDSQGLPQNPGDGAGYWGSYREYFSFSTFGNPR